MAHDPPGSSQFIVEVDGIAEGYFKSCDGLGVQQDMVEYRFSDESFIRKRPGLVKYSDITLKGGWINGDLEDWIMTFRPGAGTGGGTGPAYQRKSVSIVMQDFNGKEVRRWNLFECHPKSWKLSTLDSDGNDVLMQELTFTIEYFTAG
jgi:phage tail-like protein